jgi:hypothetical protein
MRLWKVLLLGGALACALGCGHGAAGGLGLACARGVEGACGADTAEPGVRTKGGTVSARIWALIAQGQFAEAQVLIAESTAAGLLSQTQATRMLERITLLGTRLGQVPATLQRVKDFPSQLREHTLFQIKQLLERRDFTLATQAQLKLAEKLIEQQERLMEKVQ